MAREKLIAQGVPLNVMCASGPLLVFISLPHLFIRCVQTKEPPFGGRPFGKALFRVDRHKMQQTHQSECTSEHVADNATSRAVQIWPTH